MTAETHKPEPTQTGGRWRVSCSCGWKGPLVALPGHGFLPWNEHFTEATGVELPFCPTSLDGHPSGCRCG